MALRPCLDCGALSPNTRCLTHQRAKYREREATRPSPAQRGYGAEWRRLRDQVIAEERVCRWCGHPGSPSNPLTVDHVLPKLKGGTDARENLRVLCKRCHGTKPARERREADGDTPGAPVGPKSDHTA